MLWLWKGNGTDLCFIDRALLTTPMTKVALIVSTDLIVVTLGQGHNASSLKSSVFGKYEMK